MNYRALINVMPKKELLDPQGKTVRKNLHNVGVSSVDDIRIGKRIEMYLSAESEEEASEKVETACSKLLANMIMEDFEFTLEEE